MNKKPDKYLTICIYVVLAASTFAVYHQVYRYDFVDYDDFSYVTENHNVKAGLTLDGLIWAFTTGHAANWHPMTWVSHMLDCWIFGTEPGRHHLINVVFHAANTLLLFAVFKRMTAAVWQSAFVAAVFALHPLHVESVAWISERKDVLSTLFWLLTMTAYLHYVRRGGVIRYLLTLLSFAAGLMAKPMLVSLPFVLLLLDYWPLGRFKAHKTVTPPNNRFANIGAQWRVFYHLVLEKVPFLILAAVSSIITFIVQQRGGAIAKTEAIAVNLRIANALVSYLKYTAKMFWPARLAVLYPHPAGSVSAWQASAAALVLLGISILVIWLAKNHKYLPVGWLWYLGTLVPVIGLVQVGVQAMADRYTYVPLTGLFIIVAWGLPDMLAKWRYKKAVFAVAASGVLLILAVCTLLQLRHWQNSTTLFEHTLNVTTNNHTIHNNYANTLKQAEKFDEAIYHFYKSLQIRPNSPTVYNNLGNTLSQIGRTDEAIRHYLKALSLKPGFAQAHYNLAVALSKQAKTDEAISEFRRALQLEPDYAEAMSNLGFELAKKDKLDEAVRYYESAIKLDKNNAITHGRLGLALAKLNRIDEAIKQFQFVLTALPDDAEMHYNTGFLLQKQGKTDQAIEHYRTALEIDPNYTAFCKRPGTMKK